MEPDGKVWPSMEEMETIINADIKDERLSTIRWIFCLPELFWFVRLLKLAALDESHLTQRN